MAPARAEQQTLLKSHILGKNLSNLMKYYSNTFHFVVVFVAQTVFRGSLMLLSRTVNAQSVCSKVQRRHLLDTEEPNAGPRRKTGFPGRHRGGL